jgi:uncharacterized membrane protein HdeD (DUF308 family)
MEKDWLAVGWKHLVVRGVLGIIFGILAMAWPITTAIALAFLVGCWALVDGVSSIWQAFQPEARSRVWLVVMGVLALLAAFFAIARPAVTAVALTWILGIWLIVRGVFELVGAFASTVSTPRWLLVLGGIFSLLLGFLFTANPGTGAVAVAFWLGLLAIAWGAAFIAVGFMVRRQESPSAHHGPAAAPPPSPA